MAKRIYSSIPRISVKKTVNKLPVMKNQQFKRVRVMACFTQQQVAENLNINRMTLIKYENNEYVLDMPIWFVASLVELVERYLRPDAWITIVEMYNKQFPEYKIIDYK